MNHSQYLVKKNSIILYNQKNIFLSKYYQVGIYDFCNITIDTILVS